MRVTDNGSPALFDEEAITVTVTAAANRPPVLGAIGNKSGTVGTPVTFTATATDPDAGQTRTFSLGAGAPAGATINGSTGAFSWTPTAVGSPSVTVRVTDNGSPALFDEEAITVTVTAAANRPPVLGAIGNKSGTVGTPVTFTATATDPDAGQTRTFSLGAGAPAGATINGSTGAFSWTPTAVGSPSVTVRVTDNGSPALFDEEAITVTVTAVDPPTGAVTITPADGVTDVPVNTVVTGRVPSGDIRTIFNKDTFTLKPGVATSDSSEEDDGALASSECVRDGFVRGSISYNRSHTRARFTPNCSLEHNMTYLGEIASGGGSSSAAPQTFRFTTAVARPDSDDDGGDDGEDDHDNDRRRTGRRCPYGTGIILIDAVNASGPTISGSMAISDTSARLNQAGKPEEVEFPDGLVSFRAEGMTVGTSAEFKVTFPSGIAAGSKVYQVDAGGFHEIAGAVIAGDTVTMTVTNTNAADGSVLVNPVGVAAPESSGTGSVDLSTASAGGGCSVAVRTGSGGSYIDGTLILAGLGMAVWGIRIRRRRG